MEWIRPKVRALASLPGCLATHTKPLELTPADGNGGEELFQGSYNTRLRPLCSERSDVTVSDLAAAWVRLEEAERASIARLLRRYGIAACMRNARTDVAKQAFGLEVAHL